MIRPRESASAEAGATPPLSPPVEQPLPPFPRAPDDEHPPAVEPLPSVERRSLTIVPLPAPATPELDPPWLSRPLSSPSADEAAPARPALQPLFEPAGSRSLVSALISTLHPEGEVESERLVERISRGRPVDTVPRRPRPTLRAGVQILVDRGTGMMPFTRDAAELAAGIRALAGASVTTLLYFAEVPFEAGPGARRKWRRYHPPAPGTTVVALTDIGIHAPDTTPAALVEQWHLFARLNRQAGCRLVALVPAPPHRFPHALASVFPLISWDRSTTLAAARRALGHTGGAR
ncbi:hypothetical protein [Sorangium sp. So ce117]|uniref:hypothetical protein n=1 Tax=Sorangium sp. So ce117 TaxID=3133277 RepID=UPI003F646C32